ATVVAIGSPLRPRMQKAGYNDSFILALIINSADIAFLIPPSIGMIIYGVVSNTSIAELFIAGIGPGLLILLLFSIYSWIYAVRNNVPTEAKSSWRERLTEILSAIGIDQMGQVGVLFVISIAFFIGCMFVDPIVVILVMVPIFSPVVNAVGLDPVLVGTIIVLQVAIWSATPPFGCDIFTAIAVFK
ncbi:MAG: TRAP transporter large permease subunit, partial [Guyparkeria sp.]